MRTKNKFVIGPSFFLLVSLPFPPLLPRMAVAVRCADYTDTPTTNMLPGDVNFAKLREMYLTRRLTRVEEDGTVVETTQLIRR